MRYTLRICCICLLVSYFPTDISAGEYLTAGEVATIGAVSGGTLLLGKHINKIPEDKKPLITGHLPFEESFQRWLGGECKTGKRNFLDDTMGAMVTPATSVLLLTGINLQYPRDSRNRDASQDIFLFVSGILATKGITDITKGVFARSRPYHCILDGTTNADSSYSRSYSYNSFFSGHTSAAFFSVGFLNLRVRETMRRQLTQTEYNDWHWASPLLLYGWASVVGLSRVHAYKHHLTDVIAGAVAGVLMAELFYQLGNKSNEVISDSVPMQLRISIPF